MAYPASPAPGWTRRDLLTGNPDASQQAFSDTAVKRTAKGKSFAKGLLRPGLPNLPSAPHAPSGTAAGLGGIVYGRLAFGARPGDLAEFEALGGSDSARLQAWLDDQLNLVGDDNEVVQRLNDPHYLTLNKSRAQLWADHVVPDVLPWYERIRPIYEVSRAKFVRATYSPFQLREVLVDFWHDHFSTYGWDTPAASTFVAYDRDVIRNNAFGNFGDMLLASARSITMLYYLDNVYNSYYINDDGNPQASNENYGREVLELHTLGAENYLGTMDPADVPTNNGVPIAYVEADVLEFARALAGWSIDGAAWNDSTDTGNFRFRSNWHDDEQKQVVGTLTGGSTGVSGENEAVVIMNNLVNHPGTAQYVCRKLCRRLIADNPSQATVDAAAAMFAAHTGSSDQIARVVRTIVQSSEFANSWGLKVKRPFHRMVATMRATNANFTIKPRDANDNGDPHSDNFMWRFGQTGHNPFSWSTPDGYPDTAATWRGSTPMMASWRTQQNLFGFDDPDATGSNLLFRGGFDEGEEAQAPFHDVKRLDVVGATIIGLPPDQRTPRKIAEFWYQRILGYGPSPAKSDALAGFMARTDFRDDGQTIGLNDVIDFDSHNDWPGYPHRRLRALVGLIVMSPEFLEK